MLSGCFKIRILARNGIGRSLNIFRLFSSARSRDIMEERYNDTRRYLDFYCPLTVLEENAPMVAGSLISPQTPQYFHNFYQQYHKEWDNSTALLLEVGGGPSIYTYVSAVPYVAKIYHADYLKANLNEVSMWINKDPDAFDWSPYFKYVIQKLESKTSFDDVLEREDKLRGLLHVLPCDIKADVIVPAVKVPVDILGSSFCFGSCFDSLEDYKIGLKKVYDMITPNGFFVSQTTLELTWYRFEDKRYHTSFSLSLEDVEQYYKEIGFDILHADFWTNPMEVRNIMSDAGGFGFIVARK
ncbi:nicotinamide N-methyltransferase-like [Dysidea avara]|uniref:nicotinamide N-methyltransferase-like n=1 Tax=Dysidea avara TaxID=196820 RepID=UPI0033213DEC